MGAPHRRLDAKPGTAAMLSDRLAGMPRGRTSAICAILAERGRMTQAEIEAVYKHHGWPLKEGGLAGVIGEIRTRLRGSGWHCLYTAREGLWLRAGENPNARPETRKPRSRAPGMGRPELTLRVAPPVDQRVIAGRRELTIKAAPGGCCQYLVVEDGKAVPCGAPSKGAYCAAHKAKSAGLEGTGGRW